MSMVRMSMRESVTQAPVATVLFVPSAARDRSAIASRLTSMGLGVTTVANLTEALAELRDGGFTLCLIDLASVRSAVPSIHAIRAQFPDLPVTGIIDPSHPLLSAEA